ncbi:UDP-GalNAc:beta-1,3-N-acetylgalactosaminyltransferase 1-like isoform X2 [Convolutriloba macropyga]
MKLNLKRYLRFVGVIIVLLTVAFIFMRKGKPRLVLIEPDIETPPNFNHTIIHPDGLYNKIDEDRIYLEDLSANLTSCRQVLSEDNLRVFVVLNRLGSYQNRHDIRTTYGRDLMSIRFENGVKISWKIYFIVGMPEKAAQRSLLLDENKIYNDIIALPVLERYNLSALKLLLGFKTIARNCPNAKYMMKVDDDVYFRAHKLSKLIVETQKVANSVHRARHPQFTSRDTLTTADDVPYYSGPKCGQHHQVVARDGKWGISKEVYPFDSYPFYCAGYLIILSMEAVQKIARHCGYHCVGHGTRYLDMKPKHCFNSFDDIFFGSCLMNQHSIIKLPEIDSTLRELPKGIEELLSHKHPNRLIGIHTKCNVNLFNDNHRFEKLIEENPQTEMQLVRRFFATYVDNPDSRYRYM